MAAYLKVPFQVADSFFYMPAWAETWPREFLLEDKTNPNTPCRLTGRAAATRPGMGRRPLDNDSEPPVFSQ